MRSWQWKGYGMVHLAWYALLVLVNRLYRNLLQIVSVTWNIHDFLVVLLYLPNYVVISEIREPIFSESMGEETTNFHNSLIEGDCKATLILIKCGYQASMNSKIYNLILSFYTLHWYCDWLLGILATLWVSSRDTLGFIWAGNADSTVKMQCINTVPH